MEPFHADWFGQYKYDSTFETDDNHSIRFEMKKTLFVQHKKSSTNFRVEKTRVVFKKPNLLRYIIVLGLNAGYIRGGTWWQQRMGKAAVSLCPCNGPSNVPRTRLGDRSFTVAGPRVWNCLSAALRAVEDYEQSKKLLKHICSISLQRLVTFCF